MITTSSSTVAMTAILADLDVMTPRVQRRRQEVRDAPTMPDAERSRLATQSWKDTENEPLPIRRAKLLARILEGITVVIRDGELIVGSQTKYIRGAPVHIEYRSDHVEKGITGGKIAREADNAGLVEEDCRSLLEDVAFWRGRGVVDKVNQAWGRIIGDSIFDAKDCRVVLTGADTASMDTRCADYARVLTDGLRGVIDEVKGKSASLEPRSMEDVQKIEYWHAMIIGLEAAVTYARRHAKLASEMAEREGDPVRREELRQIATVCDWVAENPARTFQEAVQSVWFVNLVLNLEAGSVGVDQGRLGQILWPYYERDLVEGRLTSQQGAELIALLWVKLNEIETFRTLTWQQWAMDSSFGQVTIGGVTRTGEDATNQLEFLMLEVTRQLKLTQPQIALRVHKNLPDEMFTKAIKTIRDLGAGMPTILNDDNVIPNMMRWGGISLEDARDYGAHGCVHPNVNQCYAAQLGPAHISMAKALELALNDGFDPLLRKQVGPKTSDPLEFQTYEDLVSAFKRQVEFFVDLGWRAGLVAHTVRVENYALPFHSALLWDCIERGKDQADGGLRYAYQAYNGPQVKSPHTVANSLMAIRKLVFEEKQFSMDELLKALSANFEGYEDVRQLLLQAPKWGNDDDEVDGIMSDIWSWSYSVARKPRYIDGGSYTKTHNGGATYHYFAGLTVGALPDGRKAGEPLADGAVSPMRGTDKAGPTAVINSVVKLDQTATQSYLFNMRIAPLGARYSCWHREAEDSHQELL